MLEDPILQISQNPFCDNDNIIENSEPYRYHDGWTEHNHESIVRLKKMTRSSPKEIFISSGEEPNEGDNYGKATMITSAGDAGEEPVEDGSKAAMIASAGDPDGKALSAASSS